MNRINNEKIVKENISLRIRYGIKLIRILKKIERHNEKIQDIKLSISQLNFQFT
jgi:hypothetical protein